MANRSVEEEVALEVIRQAGEEVMRLYASFEKIADAPADISTQADRASQELILKRLREAFGDDGLCGEEATETLKAAPADAERIWIVDPIDGTRGFARKNGEFSIMIGLVDKGEVVFGAVYEPAIDRLTYAGAGTGCYVCPSADAEPIRCSVTWTDRLAGATLSMSRSQGAEGERKLLKAFGAAGAVQTYSAGIKLAQVARGETDLYLGDYLTLKDWDICAGHILVTEAGGRVSKLDGSPIRYNGTGTSLAGKGMIATNGALHAAALAIWASGTVTL